METNEKQYLSVWGQVYGRKCRPMADIQPGAAFVWCA